MTDQHEHPANWPAEQQIERLAAALGDPTRRRVFFLVREAGDAISKDQVADAIGIDRRLAGFHLDKLVDQGFVTAEFKRRTGRTGPGAGRPAKHYRLAADELTVSLPERHYDLLASLLLKAAADESGAARQDPRAHRLRVRLRGRPQRGGGGAHAARATTGSTRSNRSCGCSRATGSPPRPR